MSAYNVTLNEHGKWCLSPFLNDLKDFNWEIPSDYHSFPRILLALKLNLRRIVFLSVARLKNQRRLAFSFTRRLIGKKNELLRIPRLVS